ncbi:hypothetical protein F4777DRAFT_580598 [Nemania sp. FL0916]|nr:hypothetical protein F4777DRAFT_580598 [Nemania sp. FL0916]
MDFMRQVSAIFSAKGERATYALPTKEYHDVDSDYGSEDTALYTPAGELPKPTRISESSGQWRLIHLGLIILYTGLWAAAVHYGTSCRRGEFEYSPARDIISYHRGKFNNTLDVENPYKGERRDGIDELWYDISTKYLSFRLTKEELVAMDKYSEKSVEFSDEKGGYMASLDVFHQVHCLNMIRQQVRRDQYPENTNPDAQKLEHIDHCIDMLREVVMCHGDVSVLTYTWKEGYQWPWANFAIERECRDWNRITDWVKSPERIVKTLRGDVLQHPTLGVSWPIENAGEKEPNP